MKPIKNNESNYKRRSIRIKGYDYSKEGLYFITICTQNRRNILSKIKNEKCRGKAPSLPNNTLIGNVIEKTIKYINAKYYNIDIEKYIIMPNHIHIIINIKGKDGALPLQDIIRIFKTYTTMKYYKIYNVKEVKLWQRNYYEHVIRNEKEYWQICEYIENNPLNWNKDVYYLT